MDVNFSGIILITGNPGAGKSLRSVEMMQHLVEEGRPVYASNYDELTVPGVQVWDDPTQWQLLEAGSVLFVDEGQRFFRQRPPMKPVPDYITAMETIRHDGVCLVLTTQKPTYIDKHMRGLVGRHEHLVEVVPNVQSNMYVFREVCDGLTDADKSKSNYQAWLHPKKFHGSYKSADVHTKKTIIPKKLIFMAVMACAIVALLVWGFWPREKATDANASQAARAAGRIAAAPSPDELIQPPESAHAYAVKHLPRFASMPWTAPIYDDRPVTADPAVYCMASSGGRDASDRHKAASCTCVTEQGTPYEITVYECEYLARNGMPYNPYKQPSQPTFSMESGLSQQVPDVAPSVGAAVVAVGEPESMARYGDHARAAN